MARFCRQCGEKLAAGENFCPSCGTKIIRDEPPIPPANNNYDNLIKFGVAVLIVLALIGVAHQRQEPKDEATYTYTPQKMSAPAVETKPLLPEELNEYDLKVGSVELGARKEFLEKIFGAGKIKSDGWHDYGDLWAKFDSAGRVSWISCMNANLSTPRGIRCGSSGSEVIAAYGNNYKLDGSNYEYTFNDVALIFHFDAGKVKEIVLVKKNQGSKPAANSRVSDGYNYSCTVNGKKTYKGISNRGLACALYSVEKRKRVTSDFGSNHTARGTFYIVTVIVGNETSEPIFVPSIYLIDERGRKFSSDTGATSTYTVMNNLESAFELNPSQPGWVYEIFDIPDDATITSLRCEASFSLEDNEFNVPFRVVTE